MNASDRVALILGRAIMRAEQLQDALMQAQAELARLRADTTQTRKEGATGTESAASDDD